MKLAYFTNIWAHYQGNIGRELAKTLGAENFRLVFVRPIDDWSKSNTLHGKMGWAIRPPEERWIVQPPESLEELSNGVWVDLMRDADIVFVGALHNSSSLLKAYKERVASGKLTFIGNERMFKAKILMKDFFNPKRWASWIFSSILFNHKNVHYFSTAYYGPQDMKHLHACKGRMWSWAYFPDVSPAPIEKTESSKLRICWAGRMLNCKKVEYIVEALALLPDKIRNICEVTIVGDGEAHDRIIARADELKLNDIITFKPLMTKEEVIDLMTVSDVYIFSSNREEGWGVVVQEAMDRSCVPIANEQAGVTRKIIDDGVDGFIFNDGDVNCIAKKIEWLATHPEERKAMGLRGWQKMQQWSPRVGAERLALLIECIEKGDFSRMPKTGLCANVG